MVTGACRGIGNAIALLYAAHGAKVIVSDSNRRAGKDMVARIKSKKGAATFLRADVNIPAECRSLMDKTIRIYGSLDIAFNNLGIWRDSILPGRKDREPADIETYSNRSSLYCCMDYEIEAMKRRGGGVIVNMPCSLDDFGLEVREYAHGVYSAKGIRINTIAPEYIFMALLADENLRECNAGIRAPSMSLSKMDQVASLVIWLSSDGAPSPVGADQG